MRPDDEGGNVLIDSPRFATQLVRKIEAMGGVRKMFLTHKDDVADHEAFARRFGCERVLHEKDITSGTRGVEKTISGAQPVSLDRGSRWRRPAERTCSCK